MDLVDLVTLYELVLLLAHVISLLESVEYENLCIVEAVEGRVAVKLC